MMNPNDKEDRFFVSLLLMALVSPIIVFMLLAIVILLCWLMS